MLTGTRTLQNKVVVITGASSGLGRAAAHEFARRGAHCVLAARREDELTKTAERCRELGGAASVVVTDITHEPQVVNLLQRALSVSGRIDVWVNNAGVTSFGLLESTPFDQHQRVIETNVFGAMFGARAVLPVFREQRSGVLINVGSVLSKIGQPFVPSYIISKFALRGLSEALRAELADLPGIHVCTLMPYAIDTPHFQEGASFVGRKAYAMPPVQSPEKVANALVDLAERPQRERFVPRVAALGVALHAVFPEAVEKLVHDTLSRWHFGRPEALDPAGNLWRPGTEPASVHGRRGPRVSLPGLVAWLIGRVVARQVRALQVRPG